MFGCGSNNNSGFGSNYYALILVLFILLAIIAAVWAN